MKVEEKAFQTEGIEYRQHLFGTGREVGALGLRGCDDTQLQSVSNMGPCVNCQGPASGCLLSAGVRVGAVY